MYALPLIQHQFRDVALAPRFGVSGLSGVLAFLLERRCSYRQLSCPPVRISVNLAFRQLTLGVELLDDTG